MNSIRRSAASRAAACAALPLLAAALVSRAGARTPFSAAPQNFSTKASPIAIVNWTAPQPGWLYVLDSIPSATPGPAQVELLDPQSGMIKGIISAGYNPDFALSNDGTRLYIAAAAGGQLSELAQIDTTTGTVLGETTLRDRVEPADLPPYSSMSLSPNGSAMQILVHNGSLPDTAGQYDSLAELETQSGQFFPLNIGLGNCGYGRVLAYPTPAHLYVLCPTGNRLRVIRLEGGPGHIQDIGVTFPWERRLGVAQAYLSPDEGALTIVRGDGAAFIMDMDRQKFVPTHQGPDFQGRILPSDWPISPDGTRIYLGYDRNPDNRFYLMNNRSATQSPRKATVDEIRAFDISTWKRTGTMRTTMPFWSLTLSKDGNSLYALCPDTHSILVIDATILHESRTIAIGGTPTLAIVAP